MTQINLVYTFENCVKRGATKEQLQDFLDRCRRQFQNDAGLLSTVNQLQKQI